MCEYTLWYEAEENLYVLQCLNCNNFQVRIFNTALMFDANQYQLFCRVVIEQAKKIEKYDTGHGFVIPAFNEGVEINLCKLYCLLDGADTEMCAARLAGLLN